VNINHHLPDSLFVKGAAVLCFFRHWRDALLSAEAPASAHQLATTPRLSLNDHAMPDKLPCNPLIVNPGARENLHTVW